MPDSFRIAKIIRMYKGNTGSEHEYTYYRPFLLLQSLSEKVVNSQLRRLFRSVLALYGAANALYWKSSERQSSTHLTVLKHQNTKTSLYKLSENHRVFALFEFFGFVRKRLQFTVFNDHPVGNGHD